jgi:AmiR/NasT family two-component response regulator
MSAGVPTVEELLKQVSALEGQADIDRRLIAELQAQGVLDRTKIDNLEIALTTARRIGAAIGILMANHKTTEAQGFELLRLISQSTNRKLRDVADEVVQTGTLPALA